MHPTKLVSRFRPPEFALALALLSGITATFWTGVACYLIAVGAFLWAGRKK